LAGWLLLALLGFVAYLTLEFAPGAFERAQMAHGADPKGVISVETGYWTVGIVALLALLAGFEPHLTRWWDGWGHSTGRRWLGRQPWPVRASLTFLLWAAGIVWRLPSLFWSFLDYLLARPLAMLAGATQRGVSRRYSWGALIMLASAGAGLLAPAPFALYCVVFAMVLVLAVVRRWSWTEADRETFLIERGERDEAQRVGFEEDLRDEALVGVTWLFVLIPLGLRQIQLATCAAGLEHCAFTLDAGGEMPDSALGQFLAWLAYFGAELAKSVPFVDWSEVFHVANDSPIKPKTTLGAQVVFCMRAALDLLLLAAVVQAVQIAGRLRDQNAAFRASRLPILEPFAETRELRRAGHGIDEALGLRPAEQHSITAFPAYDEGRLRELVRGDSPDIDPMSRMAAFALLEHQHPSEETDKLFTERAKSETDPLMRAWVLKAASGLPPDRDPSRRDADRRRLKALLADRWEERPVRAAAARALGRRGSDDTVTGLLLERLSDNREHPAVRADAGVALVKLGISAAASPIHDLAGTFKGHLERDQLIPAMAAAYACSRLAPSETPENVANGFDKPLRQHALRAARIQALPMDVDAAKTLEPGNLWDQTVRITPGEGPFEATFQMGSPDDDDQAFGENAGAIIPQ
jgi:hypothetical protein